MKNVEGLNPQGAIMMGAVTAMVMVFGFGVWAAFVPIDGAIIASGEIDDAAYRHVIQHAQGGDVAELAVAEGQQVEMGDLLFRLDDSALESEWALVSSQLIEAQARSLRLLAERDGVPMGRLVAAPGGGDDMRSAVVAQRRLFEARHRTQDRQLAQLEQRNLQLAAQLVGLQAQMEALQQEQALLEDEIETQTELQSRGLTQASRVAVLAREAARLDGSRASVVAQIAEARGQIVEIDLQAEALTAARREEAEQQLAENNALLLELTARRTILADRRAQMVLRAPASGRVHGMAAIENGGILQPATTAMQIVERPDQPVIALLVSPGDIDHVYVGQQVQVQFPALMPEVSSLEAQVTLLSAAPFLNESSGERYYRVEAALSAAALDTVGAKSLLPGLAVQAFLRTGARTPLAYLLSPITQYLHGAMRDP
ncbi:HlyD family type I secretion periplasmic adaptor subunit [Pararhodobacter oceanensis]|uniref:Membrane fusion protein (MFP) family protein n=1 Tax=Pararhodobacter oceanensis TaxID=2172121 RepID=A0A2T8HV14_9RHOB|nr:HlyD family type I secretion periplasmic adaptor subunit [Pararhodobacter oceanensis]PVH29258.1 HlyD family type I secretion periplasmic adaptor subunit [Pararhodobacter oceanensis]